MATQAKFTYRRKAPPKEARYKVTVGGLYVASRPGGGEHHKPYEWTEVHSQETIEKNPVHLFCKHVAKERDPLFISKFPDFLRLVTHDLIAVEPVEGTGAELSPNIMTEEQLHEYLAEVHPSIQTELYTDLGQLRQAVFDIESDPEPFAKNQEDLAIKRGPSVEAKRQLRELRDEAKANTQESPVPVVQPEAKTPTKDKSSAKTNLDAQGM